jgi:hypothetical protein
MAYSLSLTFRIAVQAAADSVVDEFVALHPDGGASAERQEALLCEIATLPDVRHAFAAYVALERAHHEIGDHLAGLLGLPDADLYHLLRPAIARLPIEDQEAFVDAEVGGSFFDETALLVDGCKVRLVQAELQVAPM